jgi:homopolymeric O-antigen transport system permease protein
MATSHDDLAMPPADAAAGSDGPGPVLRFRAVTARSEAPASFRSSSVRPGPLDLIRAGVRDVQSRRRLIIYLVQADLKKTGSDTLLGNIWWVVDPLLQMLVYVIFMGVILQRSTPDFPLFVFCAILPWKWFDSAVKDGIQSVVSRERLIKQIYFPKIVLPVSAVAAGVVNFAFGLIPLGGLLFLVYPQRATAWILLIPVVAAVQLVFSLAVATLLSAVNVFYRDVSNLARHVLRMWFYLSPILWGIDDMRKFAKSSHLVQDAVVLNPFFQLLGSYRNLVYEGRPPEWLGLGVLAVISVLLLIVSIFVFKRVEPSFAKVL